jgi:hypothetical protein
LVYSRVYTIRELLIPALQNQREYSHKIESYQDLTYSYYVVEFSKQKVCIYCYLLLFVRYEGNFILWVNIQSFKFSTYKVQYILKYLTPWSAQICNFQYDDWNCEHYVDIVLLYVRQSRFVNSMIVHMIDDA